LPPSCARPRAEVRASAWADAHPHRGAPPAPPDRRARSDHYGIADSHLQYYLDECAFRFNRRTSRSRGLLFYRLLQQAVNTDPHPLATLIRPGKQ